MATIKPNRYRTKDNHSLTGRAERLSHNPTLMPTATKTPVLFRPHRAGDLMTGMTGGVTDKQAQEIKRLQLNKSQGKITDKQIITLGQLLEKQQTPPGLSETTKKYISSVWMEQTLGFRKNICTDAMLKGIMCEDESIGLIQSVLGGSERVKNTDKYRNEYMEGTPDILRTVTVEEIKNCEDLETFRAVDPSGPPDSGYHWQCQSYMWLTNRKKARLIYAIVPTPELIQCSKKNSLFYKFGCQENHPDYIDMCDQIEHNNNIIRLLPAKKRIKVFDIAYDPDMIEALKVRIELAREYYQTLSL